MFGPGAERLVADDVENGRVVDVYRNMFELGSKPQPFIMFEQHTAFFMASAPATSSASIVDIALSLCGPVLRLMGALHIGTM